MGDAGVLLQGNFQIKLNEINKLGCIVCSTFHLVYILLRNSSLDKCKTNSNNAPRKQHQTKNSKQNQKAKFPFDVRLVFVSSHCIQIACISDCWLVDNQLLLLYAKYVGWYGSFATSNPNRVEYDYCLNCIEFCLPLRSSDRCVSFYIQFGISNARAGAARGNANRFMLKSVPQYTNLIKLNTPSDLNLRRKLWTREWMALYAN